MTNLNAEMWVGVAIGRMKFVSAESKRAGLWKRFVRWLRGESNPIEITLSFIYSPAEDASSDEQ